MALTHIGTEGGSHYFFGDIAEIIAFEGTALTNEQHLQVVQYLSSKYTIPEPSSGLLACTAGIGLLIRRRRSDGSGILPAEDATCPLGKTFSPR